jgi:hypothetical protein
MDKETLVEVMFAIGSSAALAAVATFVMMFVSLNQRLNRPRRIKTRRVALLVGFLPPRRSGLHRLASALLRMLE